MTPEQTLQATQLALAACQQQRNAAMDQIINLQVELRLARAELAEAKAAKIEPQKKQMTVAEKEYAQG